MASLDLVNIEKSFDSVKILHDVSISMNDGEFLVLVGPSGCGKSTLMNIIAGLEEPTSGLLRLGGRDITQVAPAQRDISMVFQSYALYPNMTVAQNIQFPLEMRKVDKSIRAERVKSVAKLLQIEHLLERKPRQLSGGQRQRVAIGRALAREPKLYLFDEPLSNLDAQLRLDMRTEIKKLHQRLKSTIVYVTHDQIEAMTLATRIAVMKGGIVQQLGTPYEVYNRPANTFVAGFMGSPRMNLAKAFVVEEAGALALDFKNGSAQNIVLPLAEQFNYLKPYLGLEVIAGIRPETINLPNAQMEHRGMRRTFSAKIEVTEPTGAETLAILRFSGHDFTATLDPDVALNVGKEMQFTVDITKLVCFDTKSEALIA
jgi:multiple sugar transport system ATP-binding protein